MGSLSTRQSPGESINQISSAARRHRNFVSTSTPPRMLAVLLAALAAFFVAAPRSSAQSPTIRTPLGVFAHISIEDALNRYNGLPTPATEAHYRAYLSPIYEALLADPAISGITVGQHWDHLQLDDPACVFTNSCADGPGGYDWSYLDDAFAAQRRAQTVQLLINPGVESPTWLMNKLPSCDGLFTGGGTAPSTCGKVTFKNFPEQAHADAPILRYRCPGIPSILRTGTISSFISARATPPTRTHLRRHGRPHLRFQGVDFSHHAEQSAQSRHGSRSGLADAHPRFLPFPSRLSGLRPSLHRCLERNHRRLRADLPRHHTRHQPRRRRRVPRAPPAMSIPTTLFTASTAPPATTRCPAKPRPKSSPILPVCGAATKILAGRGMTAGSNPKTGNIGIPGIKVLTSHTPSLHPPFFGGAEFDFRFRLPNSYSGGAPPTTPRKDPNPTDCVDLTPEQAANNTFTVFFDGTTELTISAAPPAPRPCSMSK